MRSAAADNDRRAPEESPDRSGLDASPSTSPIDLIDESLIEDVSLMAGKGPISDRRCVRRRRCRARKPRWILTTGVSLACVDYACCLARAQETRVPAPFLDRDFRRVIQAASWQRIFASRQRVWRLMPALNFHSGRSKTVSSRRAAFPWRNALARSMRPLV